MAYLSVLTYTPGSIAIKDGEISWAMMRPVDPHVINMLHKILWPAPVAHALWQYAKTVVVQGCHKIMNPDSSGQPTQPQLHVITAHNPEERRRQLELALRRQVPGGPAAGTGNGAGSSAAGRSRNGLPPVIPSATPGGEDSANSDMEAGRKAKSAHPGTSTQTQTQTVIDLARAPSSLVRGLFPTAWDQLMFNIRSVWHRQPRHPPGGCVLIFGTVNVRTTKGEVIFHVDSFYNLKKEEFDRQSLSVIMKAFMGGPPPKRV